MYCAPWCPKFESNLFIASIWHLICLVVPIVMMCYTTKLAIKITCTSSCVQQRKPHRHHPWCCMGLKWPAIVVARWRRVAADGGAFAAAVLDTTSWLAVATVRYLVGWDKPSCYRHMHLQEAVQMNDALRFQIRNGQYSRCHCCCPAEPAVCLNQHSSRCSLH